MEGATEGVAGRIDAVGNWLIDTLDFVPVDLLVGLFAAGTVAIWVENFRCWVRGRRAMRLAGEALKEA